MPAPAPHVITKQAHNNAGKGLFASKAIEPGTEILRIDRPLVSVLDSPHLKDACSDCYVWVPKGGMGQFGKERGTEARLRACQGCKIVRYCSKVSLYFLAFLWVSCSRRGLRLKQVLQCTRIWDFPPFTLFMKLPMVCLSRLTENSGRPMGRSTSMFLLEQATLIFYIQLAHRSSTEQDLCRNARLGHGRGHIVSNAEFSQSSSQTCFLILSE